MTTQQSTSKGRKKPSKPPIDTAPLEQPTKVKVFLPADVVKKLEGGNVEITVEQREAERRANEQVENERRQSEGAMAFAVQQMTTPTAAPQATEDYQAELAKLNAKFGVQPSAQLTSTAKQSKNGITRPGPTTATGRIWAAADEITVRNNRPAAIAEVKMHPDLRLMNDNTIKTQYARWRQFNDVKGRQPLLQAPPLAKGEYDGIKPVI